MTKLCARGKAAAKRKFKVYPSAYANAYASKICAGKIKDPSGVKRKDWGPKKAREGKFFHLDDKEKKSKFKIGPNISISKGSYNPNPKVKVKTENRYFGVKGEYNIIDTDTTNLKITGNVGKGSGRADVEHPFGKNTFKGEGSLDKQFGIKFTKKFSSGGKFFHLDNEGKKVISAYTGKAVRQPSETNKEFKMRHEHHTATKGMKDYYKDII